MSDPQKIHENPLNVLYVDDQDEELEKLKDFISRFGGGQFELETFSSPNLALSELVLHDKYDVCLVDLQLISDENHAFRADVWGGLQFVETAKFLSPSTSFVALSNMPQVPRIRRMAAEAGCIGFLKKLHLNESQARSVIDQLISAGLYSRAFIRMRSDARLNFSESVAHSLKRELDWQMDELSYLSRKLYENHTVDPALIERISNLSDEQEAIKASLSHVLKFYTRNRIEPSPVSIDELVSAVVARFGKLANIKVGPHFCTDPSIECDAPLIEVAISNLLQNAIDATTHLGEDREICVTVQSEISASQEEYIVIVVEDNGVGLLEGTERLVLQPMYSGENVGKGKIRFGIGCTEADKIARLHRNSLMSGSLRVANRSGGCGCMARLSLPRTVSPLVQQ